MSAQDKYLINLIYYTSKFEKKKKGGGGGKKKNKNKKCLMLKLGPLTSEDVISAFCFSAT